jgi:hypothetical protein
MTGLLIASWSLVVFAMGMVAGVALDRWRGPTLREVAVDRLQRA